MAESSSPHIKLKIESITGTSVDLSAFVSNVDFCKDGETDILSGERITIFNSPICDVCSKPALYTNYTNTEYYCEKHVPKIY